MVLYFRNNFLWNLYSSVLFYIAKTQGKIYLNSGYWYNTHYIGIRLYNYMAKEKTY